MKKLEWPGIATAVGIILIVMISLDLSKWQPLAAALIAFGGGALAYRGAMAKIDADREKDRIDIDRRKLGLYLRLRFATNRMVQQATTHRELMNRRYYAGQGLRYDIKVEDLRFEQFEEFEEAWRSLDLLPRTVSSNLDQIRDVMSKDELFLDNLGTDVVKNVSFVFTGHILAPCAAANEFLQKAGNAVIEEIDREVDRLKG